MNRAVLLVGVLYFISAASVSAAPGLQSGGGDRRNPPSGERAEARKDQDTTSEGAIAGRRTGNNDRSLPRQDGDGAVRVASATPGVIDGVGGGAVREATLFGNNLGQITQARIALRGQPAGNARVELGPVGSSGLPAPGAKAAGNFRPVRVMVGKEGLAAGEYVLEIEAGGTWHATPLKLRTGSLARIPAGIGNAGQRNPSTGGRTVAPGAGISPQPTAGGATLRQLPKTQLDAKLADVIRRNRYRRPSDSTGIKPVEMPLDAAVGSIRKIPTTSITSHRPTGTKAAFGSLLELTGNNLDNQGIQVRFNGVALTVINRSATLLTVAFPEGGPQAVTAKLEVSNGQLVGNLWHTLHPQYELMPETQLKPRAVLEAVSGGPLSSDGLPYERTKYTFLFTFHEVPGNLLEKFDMDVPYVSSATVSAPTDFSFNSFTVIVEGAEAPVYGKANAWFTTSRQGQSQSKKPFTGVKATVQSSTRPLHTITNTYALKDVLNFELTDGWGLIEGQTVGTSGNVAVGQLNIGEDLAFRITSGPTGAAATWVSHLVQLNNGWSVVEMDWEETVVTPAGAPQAAWVVRGSDTSGRSVVAGGGSFDRGQFYVGWRPVPQLAFTGSYKDGDTPMVSFRPSQQSGGKVYHNPAPYNQPHRYVRPLRVQLTAPILPDNNNQVTARLKSVKLRGPEGGKWQDAFGDSTSYKNGQWLVDTMRPIGLRTTSSGPNH